MNDNTTSSSRTPLFAAMAALALLSAGGSYLYMQAGDSRNAGAESARSDADAASAAAGMSATDRKATEAVVRAYILEHPEILTEAAQILEQRAVAQRLDAAGGALTTAFAGAVDGNPKGDVTLVEFTDYNCGFCRSSVADVQRIIGSDKNVRVVFREVPILSASSRDASRWALAAAKQGKHKAFHDAMFAGDKPSEASIRAAAQKADLDMAKATADANSDAVAAEIEANLALMQKLGVGGTPAFIIGDQILEGALGYDALKKAVADARKKV
ncbi:MAG: DsbA family protein [Sphingorhabdus sp.]